MTTKKQKREQIAAKRAAFDAETKRLGLEAQRRDREKREQKLYEAQQVSPKRKNNQTALPDNLVMANLILNGEAE